MAETPLRQGLTSRRLTDRQLHFRAAQSGYHTAGTMPSLLTAGTMPSLLARWSLIGEKASLETMELGG